ncbi:hypothetical protein [Leptospira noumeaensis]|nr:hypothetical protein [Leptospira noumeaensis]
MWSLKETKFTIELRAVGNPYRVFIGVSGAKNITEGDFELTVEVK